MSNPPGDPSFQGGRERSTTSSKRRRTSERSSLAVPEPSDGDDARMSSAPTLTRDSPQRGSSRDMTPEGSGSIKYTRTGRVSKATKGQRVHHCEECGKTYTRAEHLRRHQQNHKPGAFPCDVPGCSRSFYREDLLTRHKARHDDPFNPPSRPQSRASQDSNTMLDRIPEASSRPSPQPLLTNAPASDGFVTREAGRLPTTDARSERIAKVPTADLALQHQFPIPLPVNGDNHNHAGVVHSHWDPSPPYSPRYDSPTHTEHTLDNPVLPYYHSVQPISSRDSSYTSYLGYQTLQQTATNLDSAGSAAICLPQWAHVAQDFNGTANHSSDSEASSVAGVSMVYNTTSAEQVILPGTYGTSHLMTAAERDLLEQDDLLVPGAVRHDSVVDVNANEPVYTNENRYLGAYWLWVHPLYPIVHRPSFTLQHTSPLLKTAMLALGAHALGDATDKHNARLIHERCMKVLKKRTLNNWHTFHLPDMQAVVLVEVYALFKSRRPPLHVSKAFEQVYGFLANDHEALTPLPGDLATQSVSNYLDGFTHGGAHRTEILCKQRLLAACYILDSQHATLFGRQRTTCYGGAGMDLPFPTSLVCWDGQRRSPQREPMDRVWQAVDGGNADESAPQQPFDVFQSTLMIACLTDPTNESDEFRSGEASNGSAPVAGAMQQSAQIKLAYNTFVLCKHTPIRDLLAVAGESWVMAEKLSNQADFVASQVEAGAWASAAGYDPDLTTTDWADSQQAPVLRAVRHALRIIELHMSHPKTGLLFQEWSVYLAAIVIWARAQFSSIDKPAHVPRLVVPEPSQPVLSAGEIEQTVTVVAANAGRAEPDQEEARRVLLWAKAAIEKIDIPHNSGLTNGALDVLGKLVSRGTEDGWFGS